MALVKYKKLLVLLQKWSPYVICFIFFLAYSVLSVVRHNHYQSFGFDLGINDQVIWEYSKFHAPITTIDHIAFIPKLFVHVELIFLLFVPFYWIWADPRVLLVLQAAIVCFSGIAVFLLAKRYKLHPWLSFALLMSYLLFYGIQNGLWFDFHSAVIATAFCAWFIYFLISEKNKWAILFFLLTILSKENFAAITFLVCGVYFLVSRKKSAIYFALASVVYELFIFEVYFNYFVPGGYQFANINGMFANLDPRLMYSTAEKRSVYLYTLLSYGFLPLLNPIYLLPVLGDLASYFILAATKVSGAQGLFLQYRAELVPLMSWATIATIAKYKWLNTKWVAVYLFVSILAVQYLLHLPLSYLTKKWFWTTPSGVKNINEVLIYLPKDASVVTQDNIIPHISERFNIFTLYPNRKGFVKNSPCGRSACDWFRWVGEPQYMVVDTSPEWNILHLTQDRSTFLQALHNIEAYHLVTPIKQIGSATLFKINKNPDTLRPIR